MTRANNRWPSLDRLVRDARKTSGAASWSGSKTTADAVNALYCDKRVQHLPNPEAIDRLTVAVLAAWHAGGIEGDEYYLERDPSPAIDVPTLKKLPALPPEPLAVMVGLLTELAKAPAASGSVASFFEHYLHFFDPALSNRLARERRFSLSATPSQVPPNTQTARLEPAGKDLPPVEIVARIARLAREGPSARAQHLRLETGASEHLGSTGMRAFVEFGYAALWEHPEADRLSEVLQNALPWTMAEAAKTRLPILEPVAAFTPDQDAYLRSILATRMAKIAIGQVSMGFWDYFDRRLLIPFSQIVRAAACTVETRELAEKILSVCLRLETRESALSEEEVSRRMGKSTREGRFRLWLFGAVAPLTAALGAAYGALAPHVPDFIAGPVSALGIFLVMIFVRIARLRSGYLWWVLPKKDRLVIAIWMAGAWYTAIIIGHITASGAAPISAIWGASLVLGATTWVLYFRTALAITRAPSLKLSDLMPDLAGALMPLSPEAQFALDVVEMTVDWSKAGQGEDRR